QHEPMALVGETRRPVGHTGRGSALSPIDSLKNVRQTSEPRHLLDAESGWNLHFGLATAGQQPSQRCVLEPELDTLGETVFPRRPDKRLAVSQRESLSLGPAQQHFSLVSRAATNGRPELLHNWVL